MAVVFIGEFFGGLRADDDQRPAMLERLHRQPGLVMHAEGPTAEGWCVVSVWDSRADFRRFCDALSGPNLPPGTPTGERLTELRWMVLPGCPAPR